MRALLVAIVISTSGCIAYNDQCQPLVDNPSDRVAFIASGTELFLDRPNTRHGNNALGQQAADSLVWVFSNTDKPADFGVVNGGGLRAEGLCVTRNIIGAGPLTNGVLHEIMLFGNLAQAVDLSEDQVYAMFEHSVERLYSDTETIASPAGSFLQVSNEVELSVDCSLPAGSRITSLKIKGETLTTPGRPIAQKAFRIATSDYILKGSDGYTMLDGVRDDASRSLSTAQRFAGIDSNITAAYLKQSAFNSDVGGGFKVDASRITFTHCAIPARPSN